MKYIEVQALENVLGRICPDKRRAIMSLINTKSIVLDSEAIGIVRKSDQTDVVFTERERQVGEYLLAGITTREMAEKLKYSSSQCVKNIFCKMHQKCKTRTRIQLAFFIKSYPSLLNTKTAREIDAEQLVDEAIQIRQSVDFDFTNSSL